MTSALEVYKKRKMSPKVFSFNTFAHRGCPITPSGPFRNNIREFIQECGDSESYDVDGMPVWCTFLALENMGVLVPLYTIEEGVFKHSVNPLCNHCRIAGWNNHFVSKRKYHLIIPIDNEWNKKIEDGVLDTQTHLLHGMIHCNGFGHLLSINGIEGGSKYLCGKQIMDLWDRICTILCTRKVTVEDMSKNRTMDLRLLHGVAYGYPWFGRWNYKFLRGSFGITKHKYEMALNYLCSLPLQTIVDDFSTTDRYKEVKQIVCYYTDLSETQLITLKDLLKFILTEKKSDKNPPLVLPSRKAKSLKNTNKEKTMRCRKFLTVAAGESRWPVRRLEYTASVIVDALREKRLGGGVGMTRQEARDAARLHIGDTGLIDYVLKSMKNVIIDKFVVSRVVNPTTRVLEFSVNDLETDPQSDEIVEIGESTALIAPPVVSGSNDDVALFLYHNVLLGYPESSNEVVGLSAKAVLNSKVFVKEWPFVDENDDLLRFLCRIRPSLWDGLVNWDEMRAPPGELILVPLYATVGEMKAEAQHAYRDSYIATEGVVVTREEEGDEELVFGSGLQSGSELCFFGTGMCLGGDEVAFEGGTEEWIVRCGCGAREDDGERMVECDVCEVWSHTRCSGIEDSEGVPQLFVCAECCTSLMPPRGIGCAYEGFERRVATSERLFLV